MGQFKLIYLNFGTGYPWATQLILHWLPTEVENAHKVCLKGTFGALLPTGSEFIILNLLKFVYLFFV